MEFDIFWLTGGGEAVCGARVISNFRIAFETLNYNVGISNRIRRRHTATRTDVCDGNAIYRGIEKVFACATIITFSCTYRKYSAAARRLPRAALTEAITHLFRLKFC